VELNPFQERAVSTAGHCTVLACPGSGKTRVLSERAIRLLTSHDKGRLCAVTFTRDAAAELKSRILPSCKPDVGRRLAVGTFHSIALSQLKRLPRIFKARRLLSDGERSALLRRCLAQHPIAASFDDVLKFIDSAKARITPPLSTNPELEVIYSIYQETLSSEGAMDFADIVLSVVQKIHAHEMLPLPVRWLLVDEAQDMDEVQMEWVKAHGLAGIEVSLVGDDDQSLYAFRHAMGYLGLTEVSSTLVSTETTLPLNYRCAPNILDHSARLIAHNKIRAPKRIEAFRTTPGEVQVVRAADRWDEAELLLDRIRRLGPSAEWGILGRTNSMLDPLELSLSGANVPYRRTGGKRIWDRKLGSTYLGILRSVLDGGWTGVANALSFSGVDAGYICSRKIQTGGDCLTYLAAILETRSAASDNHPKVLGLFGGMTSWMEQSKKGRIELVIHGISTWMMPFCGKPQQVSLLQGMDASLSKLPGTLIQRLRYITSADNQRKAAGIQLMTLHSSKGLEFDNVWIVGVEEGNLPHTDSSEEEERRLMYVGMTRAKNRLIISSAMEEGTESRFLSEAGLF
jgi:superfamily I DNA/RNA helicase